MPAEPRLSRAEWMAVAVAFKDAAGCGCTGVPEPGSLRDRAGQIARILFGTEPRRPLADPRLETLRRFVCAARLQQQGAGELGEALLAHGFNRAQVEALAMLSA